MAAESKRLQKEGKRQLEEENEKLRKMMKEDKVNLIKQSQFRYCSLDNSSTKLKVRWKEAPTFSNSKYDGDSLRTIFCKYGDVGEIIVFANKKKPGSLSGLIEMKTIQSAKMAVNIETGFQENPFRSVKLLELDGSTNGNEQQNKNTQQTFQNYDQHRNDSSFNDYEMLAMRQLSQEEEQKRLFFKF